MPVPSRGFRSAELQELLSGRASVPLPEPGLLAGVLRGAQPYFDLLDWAASRVRSGVGRLTGLEPGPRAPTGEELFQHLTGLSLPENVPGEMEWRDVPGFLTEVALDPLTYLGVGGLTKTGKAAASLSKARRAARILERTGQAGEASAAARAMAESLSKRGVEQLGKTLGEQGRLGQRSLLSINLPFTSAHVPIPIVGGRLASELGLGALGRAGRAIVKPLERLGPLFRSTGRIDPRLIVERGPLRFTGDDYNALIDLGKERRKRFWARRGIEEARRVHATMRGWDPTELGESLQRLRMKLPELVNEAIESHPQLLRLLDFQRDAIARGATKSAARWSRMAEKLRAELQASLNPMTGLAAGTDAAQTLLRIGVERGPAIERLTRLSEDTAKEFGARIEAHRAAAQQILERAGGGANDLLAKQAASSHMGAATRIERTMLNKLGALAAEKKLTETIWEYLPETVRAEATRYTLVTDDALRIAQQVGVRIGELQDLHLGYLHRAVNPEAVTLQRELARHGVTGWMVQFAQPASSRIGITRRRLRALETMGISQINDAWERGIKDMLASGVPLKLPTGTIPTLFVEDPAEVMLRRLTNQGLPEGKAALMRGIVESFAVPKQWARADDMPIAEFFERARLGADPSTGKPLPRTEAGISTALQGTRWEGMRIPQEFASKALEVFRVGQEPEVQRMLGRILNQYLALMRYYVTAAAVKVPGLTRLGAGGGAIAGGVLGGALGGLPGAAIGAGLGAVGGHVGTLPLFPAYHVRNAGSNLINMWLGGFRLRDIPLLAEAGRIQLKYERALADPALMDQLVKSGDKDIKLIRQAQDDGAYWGTMASDIAAQMAESGVVTLRANRYPAVVQKTARAVLAPQTVETGQAAMRYAQFIENNAKLAMYMQGLRQGMTSHEAAERVKKFLFDYTALGPFEKRYLRRWAFFYTWVRNNMELQWSQLFEQPRRMDLLGRATGLVGESEQKQTLREHERVRLPVLAGRGEGSERVFWGLGLPQEELMLLSAEGRPGWSGIQRIGQKLLSQSAPYLRGPLEATLGVNLSSGQAAPPQRALVAMTPLSRILSSLRTMTSGDRRALWTLFGATPYVRKPETTKLLQQLDRLNALAREEFSSGRARLWTEYAPVKGQENEALRAILRKRRQIQEALKKLQ